MFKFDGGIGHINSVVVNGHKSWLPLKECQTIKLFYPKIYKISYR